MANEVEHTHVRYVVKYNDRTYEHPLHSDKKLFIRNIADVLNILEYCVTQDLKKGLYKQDSEWYNFDVVRLVNDKTDSSVDGIYNAMVFNDTMGKIVEQIVNDNRLRYGT
jgi:hypothetical protein